MDSQERRESVILTGSDMNHRTFVEEESWNSLQSTVLAGACLTNDITDVEEENLSVVNEEDILTSSIEDAVFAEKEDTLNMNIDAIVLDNDVFFDSSPSYLPKYSPRKSPSPFRSFRLGYGSSLTVDSAVGCSTSSTFDSGVDGIRTGSLLVDMIKDLDCMKNTLSTSSSQTHDEYSSNISSTAQQTANPYSSTFKSQSSLELSRSRTRSAISQVNNVSNQSTGSERKLVKASINRKVKGKEVKSSPNQWKPAGRVAKLKEIFESKKTLTHSAISSSTNRSANAKNVPKLASTKSPTYRTTSVPKVIITPARRSTLLSANRSRSLRSSSCSDYVSESAKVKNSLRARCHSSVEEKSESMTDKIRLKNAIKSNTVSTRPAFRTNRKTTLHVNSPKNRSSGIINRKSVMVTAKSSILPVRELRKFFSPSFRADATNKTKPKKLF